MSLLETAAAPIERATGPVYEREREAQTDPTDSRVSYAVDRRVNDGALFLVVTRERDGKDASTKRIPLAPVARALTLGVID